MRDKYFIQTIFFGNYPVSVRIVAVRMVGSIHYQIAFFLHEIFSDIKRVSVRFRVKMRAKL